MKKCFNNYTDEEIWSIFLSGDSLALDCIVKKHYNLLYNYGRKFSNDAGLVKDCIQELFLSIWKNRCNLGKTPCVRHYLLKALRRRIDRELGKTRQQEPGSLEFMELLGLDSHSPETIKILEEQHSELSRKILKAISTLSKRQQEIIYLRFYFNANAEEIAGIMNLSRQSVYNLLQLSIIRLRQVGANLSLPDIVYIVPLLFSFSVL